MKKYSYPEERVAVVAMGCIMPDAMNIGALWNNILEKRVSIKEIPDHYFSKSVFYSPDIKGKISKDDKTYTKIAAVIDEIDFLDLGKKYRIPPAVSAYLDNNQKAAIYCADQTLNSLRSSLPKERTAVILSTGTPGLKFEKLIKRSFFAHLKSQILNHQLISKGSFPQIQDVLNDISNELLKDTQPITEDTTTGYLQNITAGRLSNIFDLWGPSYVVDAACASALTAISSSVSGLLNYEYDAVISGGVEVTLSEIPLTSFSGINALSPDGSYPFDSRANGFVIGLGGGTVVLKRLADALRDGDYIYSIVSGYGQGSDGKGKYIAAPSEDGQIRVIQSACKMSGYSVDTIEMLEAHGTGTIVGDVVEVSALKKAFGELGAKKENYCGLGSIKSNIGHLKNAAGIAGFIKASLALENKVLPASANISEINPKLQLEGSPFYVLRDNKKWEESPLHPRRANVSSYGFGGADYHVCLEEFRPEFLQKSYSFSGEGKNRNNSYIWADTKQGEEKEGKEEAVWFSGNSIEDVINAYKSFIYNGFEGSFEKAVYFNNLSACSQHDLRISICANSKNQLEDKWKMLEPYLEEMKINEANVLNLKGIYVGKNKKISSSEIALMFPGQGSQYPNMLKGLYETYPCVKAFYMKADAIWKSMYNSSVKDLIFGNDEELKDILKNTKNTHPAMFISNLGVSQLLIEAGIKADYMMGHSLGEITSLYAGEMIDLRSAIKIVGERGLSFDGIDENKRGGMLSVKEEAHKLAEIIKSKGFNVSIANINSSDQTVVGGEREEIKRFSEFLNQDGYKNTVLNVSHAFHTNMVSKAADSFYERIKDTKFNTPKFKMMACHLSDLYNNFKFDDKDMADVLREQILSPVRFADSILKLYNKGVRVFIEAGPSNVLTNLVKNILPDKDVKVINVNNKSKCPVEGFKQALAMLFAHGVDISYVPSNAVLGLQEEGQSTIVYKAEAKHEDVASIDSAIVKITNDQHNNTCYVGENKKESLVYSGVSVGLPGTFKKAFTDDNFQYLFDGKNMIELLTDEEAESILELNITKLIKREKDSVLKKITAINEVIHLQGKMGRIDMLNDYLIDEKILNEMTASVCAGVAAGFEAIKDAGIPLIREYRETTSGSVLPGRLVLPQEMQDSTGIIFASAHSQVESVISEVSRYTAAKYGTRFRKDILKFFEDIISKVSDYESKKIMADWFALHYSRLSNNPTESDVYEFNHDFLALLSSQANTRLAQFIGANGPNMYISAACSSTASAVTVAEDLIRAGHAKRMIVIGADITSGKNMLPWFAAAFSSIGALTDSDSLYDAAVPFDNRRSGMILGSGAVGLVIEKDSDVEKRGMNGICRIMGTHMFNAAGHQTRIDVKRHCVELDRFISKMENEYNLNRNALASKMVYCSHETYSHKNGGCSSMEKVALENTFGDKFKEIKVINTKGMTGHTLGASIEEAVSAKVLQYQKIPPIVNYKVPDPDLEGLNLSKGGNYEFEYVLRTVSAFGGNGNYHLLQKIAHGDERIVNRKAYQEWIEGICSKNAKLNVSGRLLVAEVQTDNELHDSNEPDIQKQNFVNTNNEIKKTSDLTVKISANTSNIKVSNNVADTPILSDAGVAEDNFEIDKEKIKNEILEIYSEITKYPKDMLEPSMELEADLGIDTVKQATIYSILTDKYKLALSDGQALSNYPTIGHIINLVLGKLGENNAIEEKQLKGNGKDNPVENECFEEVKQVKDQTGKRKIESTKIESTKIESVEIKSVPEDLETQILKLVSEITLYPVELLDKEMDMESDLGIDTVKQATILSIIRDKFQIPEESANNLSSYNTIGALIDYVKGYNKKLDGEISINAYQPLKDNNDMDNKKESSIINIIQNKKVQQEFKTGGNIGTEILNLISDVTQYPVEMLDDDMELEADLGIDTIKQATIISEISHRFNLDDNVKMNQSELKTIRSLINMVENIVLNFDCHMSMQSESLQTTDNKDLVDLELCVQYPVVVPENMGIKDYDLKEKNILVIGDNFHTVRIISEYFKRISSSVSEFVFEKCMDSSELDKKVNDCKDAIKNIQVIIDCGHLSEIYEFHTLTYETEKEILKLNSLTRFVFYKRLLQIVADTELRILCTVSMDGCFGFAGSGDLNIDPYYGALAGFYKGLRKEIEKSKVKIVDLGNNNGIGEDVLSVLKCELEEGYKSYEIGYIDNERMTLKLDNVDRKELIPIEKFIFHHFVITGGGNGITAGIVLELSKKVNVKLTILGRTVLPQDIEEISKLDINSLEQKKIQIYAGLKKEGKKATPAEVEKEYNKLTKAISVYNLLNEVRKNGCQVRYISCDVKEHESLKTALNDAINDFGPINVVIHGAGIEKSRLIKQKTKEEFEEIFEVKANGLCNLYRLIDKKELKVLIAFSSISGRFGNEAQLDYCSANNFLSSFMSMVKVKNKGIRAISISWSGWKDVGMAWRNEYVKENSEEMGLHLIEPERGISEFLKILTGNINQDEIVISKGLSFFVGLKKWHGIKNETPLIDWVSKKDGEIKNIYKVLSVKGDPIVNHHRLGKTPIMPAVGFMEIGAQAHSLLFGKNQHYCFKNLKFENPLKLFNEKPQEIIIKPEITTGDLIKTTFYNYFKPKIGDGKFVELNSMSVSPIVEDYEYLHEIKSIETNDMVELNLKDTLENLSKKLNNAIILGPLFMDEKASKINTFKYNELGAILTVALSEEQINNKKYNLDSLLINPAFADSLMQSCGIHASAGTNGVYLPWQVDEFGIVNTPKEPGIFKAYAKKIGGNENEKTYDVILYNDKRKVCYYAKKVTFKRISQ